MEWAIQISGSPQVLRELAKSLTKPEASIVEQDGTFVLKSNKFDPAANVDTVHREAETLLRRLDGAAALELGRREQLKMGSIYRVRDDGVKEFFVRCSGGVGFVGTADVVLRTQMAQRRELKLAPLILSLICSKWPIGTPQ